MSLDSTSARLIAQELQLLNSNQATPLFFHGKTMLPFLQEADELVVEPCEFERLRTGDIIVYKYIDHFPARRVLRAYRSRDCVLINGDNLPSGMEFEVNRLDLLGVVVSRNRAGAILKPSDPEWKRVAKRAVRRAQWSRAFSLITRDALPIGRPLT